MLEPIRRDQDRIDILDQTRLPFEEVYIPCRRADDVIRAIRSLAVRGAPSIGVAGSYALWLESLAINADQGFFTHLNEAAERIKSARPTAVNLGWAVDRALSRAQGASPHGIPALLRHEADRLWDQEVRRSLAIGRNGAPLFTPQSRVLTHCNTGSLAAPGVGTALGMIREGYRLGRVHEVFVDETRPLLQGSRLTAWELLQDGIPATLITDSTAASLMARGMIDAVVVGADRIARNGDTANKIGTYGLAVQAYYHHVPFYVAAPLSTFDVHLESGELIPIEERLPEEVKSIANVAIAPQDIAAYNPAFDVTPGYLITAIVTDAGVLRMPYRQSIPTLLSLSEEENDD